MSTLEDVVDKAVVDSIWDSVFIAVSGSVYSVPCAVTDYLRNSGLGQFVHIWNSLGCPVWEKSNEIVSNE